MTLYHGSHLSGLTVLKPSLSNHDKAYVYLSDNATLALFYAYNPIRRPGGFFPYWFDKHGTLLYDEYFPDQLRLIYAGHDGWIYHTDADSLPRLDKMPWVHLSESPVPITHAEYIPDLYQAMLDAEKAGKFVFNRYESIPESQRDIHRRVVRNSLAGRGEDDYVQFMRRHIPELFE